MIGSDLIKSLGLIIDFKHESMCWDKITMVINRTKLNDTKELNKNFQSTIEPKRVQKANELGRKFSGTNYLKKLIWLT